MDNEDVYRALESGSLEAAQALLGWKLVHETPNGKLAGIIVETEAYDQSDPASHSYRGLSARNAAMFEGAGTIYVYFTYGMHYCMNIVTGQKGHGQGVLLRALEPTDGIEQMRQNRAINDIFKLTNGPAKLVQALGVTMADNGSVLGHTIYLEQGVTPQDITKSPRIGITKGITEPWRFYITGNPYVSYQKRR